MSMRKIGQVPIYPIPTADPSPTERREHCKVSADVADELGVSLELLAGGRVRILLSVTRRDVNVLFNPGYVDFLGQAASFTVDEIVAGSHRVEIHPNSGPGERDGGVYRLYGSAGNPFLGASIPTNARVTLSRVDADRGGIESGRLQVPWTAQGSTAF